MRDEVLAGALTGTDLRGPENASEAVTPFYFTRLLIFIT